MDSGFVFEKHGPGGELKSMVGWGWVTNEEGKKLRQGDSGILSDCLEQSVSSISM